MPKKSAPKPAAARTTKPKTDAPSWRDGDDAQNAKTGVEIARENEAMETAILDHIKEHGATARSELIEVLQSRRGFDDDQMLNDALDCLIEIDTLCVTPDGLIGRPWKEPASKSKAAKPSKANGTNGSNGHAIPNVSEAFTPEEVAALHNGASQLSQNFAAGEGEALEADAFGPTRYLSHALTADEITALRVEREMLDADIDILQAELDQTKERARSLQKRIDTKTEDGRMLSKRVRTGEEYRDVPCEERRGSDPREGATQGTQGMATYRLDTGECIDWRELSKSERQGKLFADTTFDTAPAAL